MARCSRGARCSVVVALVLATVRAAAQPCANEGSKPVFPIGVMGPFSLQEFHIIMFDILSAKLDFESSSPLITHDVNHRTLNNSCFGVELHLIDEAGSKDRAREGALQLCLGDQCSAASGGASRSVARQAAVALVAGQVPSNCADSAEISTTFRIPQVAWGCAMELVPERGFFMRTHQMDFPDAFTALQSSLKWSRATVVWESSETFSHYNFAAMKEGFVRIGAAIHEVRLERKPNGGPDFESWAQAFARAKEYHDKVWIVLTGPGTSRVLFPWMMEHDIIQPWMQLVAPGSTKSSIIGLIKDNGKEMLELLSGSIIIRPLSHHTLSDDHRAADFFGRLKSRTVADFRNSPSAFGLDFDPVELADAPPRGNGTTQAMLDDPAALFQSNHNWPLAYDALYTVLFAIDELLRANHAPDEIHSDLLLQAMARQTFMGMSKLVSFEGGKRPGDWAIDNLVDTGAGGFAFNMLASYESAEVRWNQGREVHWMDGTTSGPWKAGAAVQQRPEKVPEDRQPRCPDGMVRSANSSLCFACPPGTSANRELWSSLEDPNREVCGPCPVGFFAAKAGTGTCEPCPPGSESRRTGGAECVPCEKGKVSNGDGDLCVAAQGSGWELVVLIVVISVVVAIAMLLLARSARHRYRTFRKLRQEYEEKQNKRVKDSIRYLDNLEYPFNFVRANDFIRAGSLIQHEILRDQGKLVVLDSFEAMSQFADEHKCVFISHQWTSFKAPDPNKKQFNIMVKALKHVVTAEGWDMEKVMVWVDFSAIPQRHPGIQALAIRSLTAYASSAAAFIITAPTCMHQELGTECNVETYMSRMWCRAEQICHSLRNGIGNMWLANEDGCSHVDANTFSSALRVFHGDLTCCRIKHKGMAECDRESLVLPILGLYGALKRAEQQSSDVKEFLEAIASRRDELFPRTFIFEKEGRPPVKRELFGDLVDRMDAEVENDSSWLSRQDSMTRGTTHGLSFQPVDASDGPPAQKEISFMPSNGMEQSKYFNSEASQAAPSAPEETRLRLAL